MVDAILRRIEKLPPSAQRRLEQIKGRPMLINSEMKGGAMTVIYPHCDHAALEEFNKNWGIYE